MACSDRGISFFHLNMTITFPFHKMNSSQLATLLEFCTEALERKEYCVNRQQDSGVCIKFKLAQNIVVNHLHILNALHSIITGNVKDDSQLQPRQVFSVILQRIRNSVYVDAHSFRQFRDTATWPAVTEKKEL